MMRSNCTIFDLPIFDKNYYYKIQLLGTFRIENLTNKGILIANNIYLKSHNVYYCIKADLVDYKVLTVKVDMQDEFKWFRCPEKVIVINDDTELRDVTYNIFPKNTELIFNTNIKSITDFRINSDIINLSLTKGIGFMDICIDDAIKGDRNTFINTYFSGKEKEDIMKIFIDNDKFQEESYTRLKYKKGKN